ncbi:MAG: glutamate--tRNA ligase [Desulfobacterales bacterium]
MKQDVIVRFAPSPTGYLHIGGARTAIYNWLFAQKTGGKLILRIEDTDAQRSTEESIKGIIDGLDWLGITWDEGPYFQTQFINEHLATAKKLLDSGHVYKCFCSKEALENKRAAALKLKKDVKYDGTCRQLTKDEIAEKEAAGIPYTLRMKVPNEEGCVSFEDIVYGKIDHKYQDIEDFVIVRSNGQPLYLLSNTVDDIRDRVTHVIRGQDGLSNTHRQILIYQALGAPVPRFAHMSLTLDPKKAKISKRKHGELVAVHFYKEHGFLPWAFLNFLVLLGWATPESREIFSQEELIEAFSLEGIGRANSIFNVNKGDPKYFTDPKAVSINAHYLRTMPVDQLAPYIRTELKKAGIWDPEYETGKRRWFLDAIELTRSRFHLTTDFATRGRAYFSDDFEVEDRALNKNIIKHPQLEQWLPMLADRLEETAEFTASETEEVIREMAQTLDVKPGVLINGIRTAVTGQLAGPGIFDILITIGQRRVVDRLRNAPTRFKKQIK